MRANWRFSRRALLRSLLAARLRPLAAAESLSFPGDPVSQALRGFSRVSIAQRRYRVDAVVLLCGVPLFSRKNVGSGYASVETATGAGSPVALQFAAGSLRSRAGVNRFGVLREAVAEDPGDALRFSFAGLITQSPEQDLEQARRSLLGGPADGLTAAIAAGESKNGVISSSTGFLRIPSDSNWTEVAANLPGLLQSSVLPTAIQTAAGPLAPFLYLMRAAALAPGALYRRPFLHCGKRYVLETRRSPSRSSDIRGQIHDHEGVKCAEFRAAYSDGSGIPCRIEYRPKSFLRLVLEAEPPQESSLTVPSVFPQETL
jgi:hypothetical protein